MPLVEENRQLGKSLIPMVQYQGTLCRPGLKGRVNHGRTL